LTFFSFFFLFFFSFSFCQRIQSEEEYGRIIEAAVDVAKSMQDLLSISASIKYTPGAKPQAHPRLIVVRLFFFFFFSEWLIGTPPFNGLGREAAAGEL